MPDLSAPMKRIFNTSFFLCALLLILAAGARAQHHQHQHADSTQAAPMEHGGMMDVEHMGAMMPRMMQMHERMMADPVIHERMMADPEMHAVMAQIVGAETDMGAMHERMATMSLEERQAMMSRMHERMMARMEAMPAEERQALMQRMVEAHHRLMADPAVHERMMADPEMRRMMQEGGMMHDG